MKSRGRACAAGSGERSRPSTRSIWRISKQGSIRNLVLVREPVPRLEPGQALVEVKAIGLNFADVFCCLGLYNAAPKAAFVPGLEFSGEVVAVFDSCNASTAEGAANRNAAGSSVTSALQLGDQVLGVTRFGAYATHVSLDCRYLRRVPKGWSFEQAAAFPVQTLTAAYGLLDLGSVQRGHAVLVHSAAGGVGLQALQLCRAQGAYALGLVGSAAKLQLLQQLHPGCTVLGADGEVVAGGIVAGEQRCGAMCFAVRPADLASFAPLLQRYLQLTGRPGFDCVLDSVGGRYWQPSYDAMAPCGRHVVFGAADLTPPPGASLSLGLQLLAPANLAAAARLLWAWLQRPRLDVLSMPGHNKSVMGFNLIWLYDQLPLMERLYGQVEALRLEAPHVGAELPWRALPAALELLQSGRSVGKVVVTVADCDRDAA